MTALPKDSALPLGCLLLLFALSLSGCQSASSSDAAKKDRVFQPANYQGVPSLPADVLRVVVLPTAGDGTIGEETLLSLDPVLLKALNQTRRFECVALPREICARYTRQRAVRSVDVLPYDFFPKIASEYAATAVLFLDITHYQGYAPLALGLRAKLVRLDNRTMLWSFDELYSASQPEVANGARRHWQDTPQLDTPTNLGASAIQSPTRFAAYVAHSAFSTMPQRYR